MQFIVIVKEKDAEKLQEEIKSFRIIKANREISTYGTFDQFTVEGGKNLVSLLRTLDYIVNCVPDLATIE